MVVVAVLLLNLALVVANGLWVRRALRRRDEKILTSLVALVDESRSYGRAEATADAVVIPLRVVR
jgi:hypothetical protein